MKRNTLKKIITGVLISTVLISTVLISETLAIQTKAYAKTVVQKPITNVVKNIKYSFKGYQNGVPIYASIVKSENLQCVKTQDSVRNMINNLDNFGLYYVSLGEINKVKDVSARNTYKTVIDKYRKQSATPYITDILTKLNALKKAPNLLDYNNLLNDVKSSKLKQTRDLKYNVAYVQNEINSWVNSGKFYTKPEADAIKLIKIAQNMGTVKNIDNAKKVIAKVSNKKSIQWLNGEVNKIQLIDQVKSLPFSGATCPIVDLGFSKYNKINVTGDFVNLLNKSAAYLTGNPTKRFEEVKKAWMGKIVAGKYKVVNVDEMDTTILISDYKNPEDVFECTSISDNVLTKSLYYNVYSAQKINDFSYNICRFIVEFERV